MGGAYVTDTTDTSDSPYEPAIRSSGRRPLELGVALPVSGLILLGMLVWVAWVAWSG